MSGALLAGLGCHPAAAPSGWPADAKREFIQGCEAHSLTPKRCACAADALEKTTRWADFRAMAKASQGGKAPTPEFSKLVKGVDAQCAQAASPLQPPAHKPAEAKHWGAPWK